VNGYLAAWYQPSNVIATGVDRVRRLVGLYVRGTVQLDVLAGVEDEFRRLAVDRDPSAGALRILLVIANATDGVLLPKMVKAVESEVKGFLSALDGLSSFDLAAVLP
jgi:hypothetical protein